MRTYTLDIGVISKFEERLAKFQKKFAKYGNGVIVYEKSDPYTIRENGRQIVVVDVTVDAQYRINDYDFVALLEWNDATKCNLIKTPGGEMNVPEEYRYRTHCDHCNTNRYRKHSVVLKNTITNDYIQVGKSCVCDYLGKDMGDYASYLSFYSSLDDEVKDIRDRFYTPTVAFTFDEIILQTLEYVRRFGYTSKSHSFEYGIPATSTRVYNALNHNTAHGELIEEEYEITPSSKEKLLLIKDWVSNLDMSSDYNFNLKVLMESSYVENNNLGLVVSAVGSYAREMEKRESAKKEAVSKYVGEVGKKIEITATPECVFQSENDFGYYYIYKMVVNGDVVVWKTNKFLEPETEVVIKATVKDHSEYRGVKQTEITRGRVSASHNVDKATAPTMGETDADDALNELFKYLEG